MAALALVLAEFLQRAHHPCLIPFPGSAPLSDLSPYPQGLNTTTDSELVVYLPVVPKRSNKQLMGTGQAEFALCVSTRPTRRVIGQLGIYAPIAGVTHTVTLWDSATGQVLVQINITTNAPGEWTLPSWWVKQTRCWGSRGEPWLADRLQHAAGRSPDHPDTLAHEVHTFNGIYDFKANAPPGNLPMLPFTEFGDHLRRGVHSVEIRHPYQRAYLPATEIASP